MLTGRRGRRQLAHDTEVDITIEFDGSRGSVSDESVDIGRMKTREHQANADKGGKTEDWEFVLLVILVRNKR